MSVININLFSMMLRRTIDVTVVLPDKINDDEKLPCESLFLGMVDSDDVYYLCKVK